MAYSDSKNPRYRFWEYTSSDELFDDILSTFPKKSTGEKVAESLAIIFPADRDYHRAAKTSVLTVIATITLTVVGYIIFCLIATPENVIKNEITTITSDYYENYFYNKILDNNYLSTDDADFDASTMENILGRYTARGFATVSLRQLLLTDNSKPDTTAYLEKYCNLDRSNVKIYPEAPFSRQDYHVEYSYSCKF